MLMIKDLTASKELDGKAMAGVYGGSGEPSSPSFGSLFNVANFVADVDLAQGFNVNPIATNHSIVNAAQGNTNGNGFQYAPQDIYVYQDAYAYADNIGNTDVTVG